MVSDFDEANAADIPSFFFHLGDVVYYFGESSYYYDQFYEPYRVTRRRFWRLREIMMELFMRATQNRRSLLFCEIFVRRAWLFRPMPAAYHAPP